MTAQAVPETTAPRSLTADEGAYQAGAAAAAKLPPMSRETAQRIAPVIAAALAELDAKPRTEENDAA